MVCEAEQCILVVAVSHLYVLALFSRFDQFRRQSGLQAMPRWIPV